MPHPRMYDDADPLLARVRRLCGALPGSVEKESWGRPTFRAPIRLYAVYGSSGTDHPTALIFKPEEDERPALVAELLASSYRQVAPALLVRALDSHALGRPGAQA